MMTAQRIKALPLRDWPPVDRMAWEQARHADSLLSDRGPAAHWSEKTCAVVVWAYGRWLRHCLLNGIPLDEDIAARVTPQNISDYVAILRSTVNPNSVHNYVSGLYDALRVMAPESDWRWLRDIRAHLARGLLPSHDKTVRVTDSAELFDLGIQLMREGAYAEDNLVAALRYRDGLIIALLACRPLRRRNLAAIRIGTHLVNEHGTWRLHFSADEMKNRRPYSCELPAVLASWVDGYLEHVRLLIYNACTHDGLWASSMGGPMRSDAIHTRIVKHTRERLGTAINPHLFRNYAATSLALKDPEHVRAAASVLGHADLSTTHHYYIKANAVQATRAYQEHIEKLQGRRP